MTDIDSNKTVRLCKRIARLMDEAQPNCDEAIIIALTIFTSVCHFTAKREDEPLEDRFDAMVMAAAASLGLDEGDPEFTETLQ